MEKFEGCMTIRVQFKTRAEYEKFRKLVLKTEWSYELDYPMWEEIKKPFSCSDDIDEINRLVIYLLQMGFDVYCCRYSLKREVEYPAIDTTPEVEEATELSY